MKHISEILPEVFAGIMAEHKPHPFNIDAIRKEKACLIEDIFRVMKLSQPMNSIYTQLISYDGCIGAFDDLYDMTIMDLELLLAHMQAELSFYMKECQQASMKAKFIPDYQIRRRNRFRDSGDDSE